MLATTTFDVALGVVLVAFALVFAASVVVPRFQSPSLDPKQTAATAFCFFFLGLGRLLGAELLSVLGLAGLLVAGYLLVTRRRRS